MRHTLTITKVVLSGALLGVIILITLVLLRQFTNVGKSMLVQEKLESFIASKKAAVKLSKIFPWPWERLCSTGDIATKEAFEDALGRDDTIRVSLRGQPGTDHGFQRSRMRWRSIGRLSPRPVE